jgi:hypothetical protein
MVDGPETLEQLEWSALGDEPHQLPALQSSSPWTIWMRKKMRTTTMTRMIED